MATNSLALFVESVISGSFFETDQLAPVGSKNIEPYRVKFAYGTGTNQAKFLYAERFTNPAPATIDLQAVVDVLGVTRLATNVSFFVTINRNAAEVCAVAGSFLSQLGSLTAYSLYPMGLWMIGSPVLNSKYVVTAGAKTVTLAGTGTYDVAIIGEY